MSVKTDNPNTRSIRWSLSSLEDLIPESGTMYGDLNWTCSEEEWAAAREEVVADALAMAADAFQKGYRKALDDVKLALGGIEPPTTPEAKEALNG